MLQHLQQHLAQQLTLQTMCVYIVYTRDVSGQASVVLLHMLQHVQQHLAQQHTLQSMCVYVVCTICLTLQYTN